MPRNATRNRVVAGAFLLMMLAAAVTVLVLVGGWSTWLEEKQTLRVRFDAAPNVKIGSPVLLAGHPVGRVTAIAVVEAPCPPERKRGDKCYLVEVAAELPKTYHLYQNARLVLSQALVGQSAALNIEEVGFGEPLKDALVGNQQSPFAGAAHELGIGEAEKADISAILANIKNITESAKAGLPEVVEKIKVTGTNLAAASEKVNGTLKEIDAILADNRENLKTAVSNVRSVTEKADKGADEVMGNLKTATSKVNAIIDDNRGDIREAVQHVKSVTEKADKNADEILASVRATTTDLKAAVADFKVIAGDTKALVATNRGNISTALQSFRETGEHLRELAKEVRRAPWRLFATPDKKEVESLNLYDTARAFAAAATELDAVADTLAVMADAKTKGVDVDPEILKGMQKRLEETFGRYQEAENALLKEFERIKK